MRILALGLSSLLIVGGVLFERNESERDVTKSVPSAPASGGSQGRKAVNLEQFAGEVSAIERELAATARIPRAEFLARYGRSRAASGQFHVAAAAYAMFLAEFGLDHPYAAGIALRYADCLFPFRYDQIDVIHTASGPKLLPAWRMDYSPRPEHLRLAVDAMELAASLASDERARGSALLKLGWVHRVLGDWQASTAAWERCAAQCPSTKLAADALWLAAENLEWSNRPGEAAGRLEEFARRNRSDARTPAAVARVEDLRVESQRMADALTDPVGLLKAEIDAGSKSRSSQQVYRYFVRSAQRRGLREAWLDVSRWACEQTDWPASESVLACFDMVDALVASGERGDQEEAVQRLREIVDIAPEMNAGVSASLRCARLLRELDRHDEADQVTERIAVKAEGSRRWEPVILSEYADSLIKRGDGKRAMAVLKKLASSHPDYDVADKLAAATEAAEKEGE